MTGKHNDSEQSDELGFDPESPNVNDPQVDPTEPATPPADKQPEGDYPPYYEPDK